jgi:hypothetical protein
MNGLNSALTDYIKRLWYETNTRIKRGHEAMRSRFDMENESVTVRSSVPMDGSKRTGVVLSAIAFILLAIAYCSGLARGDDRIVSLGEWGRFMYAISAAATDLRAGLPGYVILEGYWSLLEKAGFIQEPKALQDPVAMNRAFKQAWNTRLTLPPPELQKIEYGVRGASADDLGFVDYAKMAFTVFGPRIQGFYHLYYTILAVSVCLFVLTFWRSPTCMLTLIAVLLSFCLLLQSDIFGSVANVASVQNPRFASSFGIVALLHILCTIFLRLPPSAWHVIAVLIQAEIIYFGTTIRASSLWMLIAIGFVWIAMIVYSWYDGRFSRRSAEDIRYALGSAESRYARRGGTAVANPTKLTPLHLRLLADFSRWRPSFMLGRLSWSVLACAVVFFVSAGDMKSRLHPLYRDGGINHHAFWHSVYYSLMFNPLWFEKYGPSHPAMSGGGPASGDEQPISAIRGYLAAHPPQDRTEVYDSVGNIKWGAMEKYVRIVFFDFVRNDPWFVVQTFGLYKPLATYDTIAFVSQSLTTRHPIAVLMAVVIFCYGYFSVVGRLPAEQQRSMRGLLWLLSGVALISYLPNMLTVIHWNVMGEQIWISMAVTLLVLAEALRYVLLRWAPSEYVRHFAGARTAGETLTQRGLIVPT